MAATFAAGDTFTIALYTGDPGSDFAPMTSPSTFENVTPEFLDANSGLTLIHQEDFLGTDATGDAPDGQVDVRNFVTFELSDPVVPGGEAITVFGLQTLHLRSWKEMVMVVDVFNFEKPQLPWPGLAVAICDSRFLVLLLTML